MKTKKVNSLRLLELAVVFIFLIYIGFSCASKDQYDSVEDKTKSSSAFYENLESEPGKIEEQSDKAVTDTISNDEIISSSAAVVTKDSTRKFIRTADIKFRVNNVRSSTLKIEDIVGEHNGFVS